MEGGERLNRSAAMAMVVGEEGDKEREIIQLHRLCSRSQTICVCKEQKRNKKQGKKRRNVRKEDETSITEKEAGNPSKRKGDREERKGEDK